MLKWTVTTAKDYIKRNGGEVHEYKVFNGEGGVETHHEIRTPSQVGCGLNGAIDFLVNHRSNYHRAKEVKRERQCMDQI